MRRNFTKRVIEALEAEEKRYSVLDTVARGLAVAVQPTGSKTFYHVRKVEGYPHRTTLGLFPEMTIEEARGKADELNGKLSKWRSNDRQGPNPLTKMDSGTLTFGQLVDKYIEKRVKARATQPETAERWIRWVIGKYLSELKNRKLHHIRREDVRRLHDQIGTDHGKVIADRCVQFIRRVYYWAASGKVELFLGENPASKGEFNGCGERDRFLQPDELVRLDRALRKESNKDLRDFVELALATGARRSNVLAMQWSELSELNADTWTWTIAKTKTAEVYVLPLTPRAITVLNRRRTRLRESGTPWVFPSPVNASAHMTEPRRTWRRLLKRAKIENFTIHDLRRTNASYQAISGQTLQAIAKTLGHASTASTEIYAKLNTDVARAALLAGAGAMEQARAAAKKGKDRS